MTEEQFMAWEELMERARMTKDEFAKALVAGMLANKDQAVAAVQLQHLSFRVKYAAMSIQDALREVGQ